jgi:RepB DNA-primase N-terminal domain
MERNSTLGSLTRDWWGKSRRELLNEVTSTRAAKALARCFGGDLPSADWRHFGRLAGFTNPKRERQLLSGMQPFARLIESRWVRLQPGENVYRGSQSNAANGKNRWNQQGGRGGQCPCIGVAVAESIA